MRCPRQPPPSYGYPPLYLEAIGCSESPASIVEDLPPARTAPSKHRTGTPRSPQGPYTPRVLALPFPHPSEQTDRQHHCTTRTGKVQSGGRADSGRSGRAPSPSTSPVERIATATLAGNRKEIPRRKSRSASTLLRPQHSLPFPADDKRQIHKKPPQDSGPAEASVR